MEQLNPLTSTSPGAMLEKDKARGKDWTPFWVGCLLGIASWIVVFLYFFGGGQYDNIPGFVYGILFAYFVFFNTFPVNMFLQCEPSFGKFGKLFSTFSIDFLFILLNLSFPVYSGACQTVEYTAMSPVRRST